MPLLRATSNEALFSIIGTTYGGNGVTTFALPNVQDRSVMSWGQGPGLSNYDLGQISGTSTVTLKALLSWKVSWLMSSSRRAYVTSPPTRTTD